MKKLILTLMVALLAWGCPDPQTGKIDPYLTARTIILQANTALSVADGIFQQWLLGQSDQEKVAKAQKTYTLAKSGVTNGLQMALNGVNIAEQAKKDPDIKKLMSEANEAWTSLRKFLEDLFAPTPPASQPTSDGIRAKLKLIKKPAGLKLLPTTLGP
jgi:hypothetical protein